MKENKTLPYYTEYEITKDRKIIHIDTKEEVEQTYCNKDNTYKVKKYNINLPLFHPVDLLQSQ